MTLVHILSHNYDFYVIFKIYQRTIFYYVAKMISNRSKQAHTYFEIINPFNQNQRSFCTKIFILTMLILGKWLWRFKQEADKPQWNWVKTDDAENTEQAVLISHLADVFLLNNLQYTCYRSISFEMRNGKCCVIIH